MGDIMLRRLLHPAITFVIFAISFSSISSFAQPRPYTQPKGTSSAPPTRSEFARPGSAPVTAPAPPAFAPPGASSAGSAASSTVGIPEECEAAYYAKLTLAAAAGSCDVIEKTEGASTSGKSVCGNPTSKPGSPAQPAKYSMVSHAPVISGNTIATKEKATDCSGTLCQAWGAQGFRPFGKDLSECPTAADWAKKESDCFEVVTDNSFQVGDARCGPNEGTGTNGATGHCVFVCDQQDSSVVAHHSPIRALFATFLSLAHVEVVFAASEPKPTTDLTKLTVCEARDSKEGWKTFSGDKALTTSKLMNKGARTLRPFSRKDKPQCYGQPLKVKDEEKVKNCPTLPKIETESMGA